MRINELVQQSLKVFSFPRGVLLYCLFALLVTFLNESGFSLGLLSFLTTIFAAPLVTSMVLSWFFIESIGPSTQDTRKRLQTSFYFPFFKGQLLFFWGFMIAASFFFGKNQDSLPAVIIYNTSYALWCFITVAIMFQKNRLWKALGEGLRSAGRLFILFIFTTGIFTFLDMARIRLKRAGQVFSLQSVLIIAAENIIELMVMLLLMRFFISRKGQKEAQDVLSGYLAAPVESAIEEEKQAMRKSNKCLWLGVFSWVPLVQLFSLYFGYKRFTRQQYGKVRSLFGLVMGAFFTFIYLASLIGFFTHGKHLQKGLEEKYHMASFEKFSQRQSLPEGLRNKLANLGYVHDLVKIPELIKEIEELKLDDQESYFTLGIANLYLNENEKAFEMFEKSSAKDPSNGDPFFFLGMLSLNNKHDIELARRNFSRYLRFNPGDKIALQWLELADNAVAWGGNIWVTIFSAIVLIFSIILHEYAHSYTAYKCGDPTSKEMGRLSFNPFAHLDPFGSVILPAMLIINKSPIVFGWAKPVIINPEKLKQPDRDHVLISLAGCSMNFFLAMTGIILLTVMGLVLGIVYPHCATNGFFMPKNIISFAGVPVPKVWAYANIFLSTMVVTNIVLGIFNLIPIPPLDGSWILEKRFSPELRKKLRKYYWVVSILLLVLLFTGVINIILSIGIGLYVTFMQIFVSPSMGLA